MTRRCSYCQRWFQNKQSVRAHLRHCEPWKASDAKAALDSDATRGVFAKLPNTHARAPGICVACGRPSADMTVCICGGSVWLPPDAGPKRCPACLKWLATERRDWNGRCDHCHEPMSEAALRADLNHLRARILKLDK